MFSIISTLGFPIEDASCLFGEGREDYYFWQGHYFNSVPYFPIVFLFYIASIPCLCYLWWWWWWLPSNPFSGWHLYLLHSFPLSLPLYCGKVKYIFFYCILSLPLYSRSILHHLSTHTHTHVYTYTHCRLFYTHTTHIYAISLTLSWKHSSLHILLLFVYTAPHCSHNSLSFHFPLFCFFSFFSFFDRKILFFAVFFLFRGSSFLPSIVVRVYVCGILTFIARTLHLNQMVPRHNMQLVVNADFWTKSIDAGTCCTCTFFCPITRSLLGRWAYFLFVIEWGVDGLNWSQLFYVTLLAQSMLVYHSPSVCLWDSHWVFIVPLFTDFGPQFDGSTDFVPH